MPDVPQAKLWNELSEGQIYPVNDKWHSHLLDQYKLYVEMADRISQRRTAANTYFLSVNSAILAFVGYLTSKTEPVDYMWLLALAGCMLTLFWYNIINSYKNLNTAASGARHRKALAYKSLRCGMGCSTAREKP
ncbi:RipA family octameric membrane protein [Comamonas piscis]|uniref:RipA family octameric membrane protein n=1 Tax=Comamonas piscis TaxID=1562974 RepID=UPI003B588C0B